MNHKNRKRFLNLVPRVSHLPAQEDERPWERGWRFLASSRAQIPLSLPLLTPATQATVPVTSSIIHIESFFSRLHGNAPIRRFLVFFFTFLFSPA